MTYSRQEPWWYNEESKAVLDRGYLLNGETIHDAIDRITSSVCHHLGEQVGTEEVKEAFKDAIYKGWLSLSSPIWTNAGTSRGLPISCQGCYIGDSISDITTKLGEVMMHTKLGAGTSAYFGNLRGRGASITNNGKSSGAVSFMKLFDTVMTVVTQGSRRGSFAAYLDIDHPDIEEFLRIKDIGSDLQNIFYAVCVPDYWMIEMIEGDAEKRRIWARVLESRVQKGLPYIWFSDTNNINKPEIYQYLGCNITHSNLCSEIALPDADKETFICCLCSLNLALYDEWKDSNLPELAVMFLDGILSEYIAKTDGKKFLKYAANFAKRHRAIGIGVLGWHSYLQSKMIPFGSLRANALTTEIFRSIQEKTTEESRRLAELLGPAPIFEEGGYPGVKYRNTTRLAIAPTTSSSSILGQVSPGIEPYSSNYYKVGLAKGNFIRKNIYLRQLLESKGKDTYEVWREIMMNAGSVQHLDFLTPEEKEVFKTFREISQKDIIVQASIRQKFIDQSQSLNLNIPPEMPIKEVNRLIIEAWKLGIKGLYYQRSNSVSKDMITNLVTCTSCEA